MVADLKRASDMAMQLTDDDSAREWFTPLEVLREAWSLEHLRLQLSRDSTWAMLPDDDSKGHREGHGP